MSTWPCATRDERLGHRHLLDEGLGVGVVLGHRRRRGGVADRVLRPVLGQLHPGRFLVGVDRARGVGDHLLEQRRRLVGAAGLAQHSGQAERGRSAPGLGRHAGAVGRLRRTPGRLSPPGPGPGPPARRLRRRRPRPSGRAPWPRRPCLGGRARGRGRSSATPRRIGGRRGLRRGDGLGACRGTLQDRQATERLALGRPRELARRGLIGVDGVVDLEALLQEPPQAQRASPAAGLSIAATFEGSRPRRRRRPPRPWPRPPSRGPRRWAPPRPSSCLLRVLLFLCPGEAPGQERQREKPGPALHGASSAFLLRTASTWRDARRETGRGQACHHEGGAHPFPRLPSVRGDVRPRHRDGEAGRIASIRGDEDDPFSLGHVCPKAVALKDVHEDEDRLRRPLRRTATGFEEVSWDEALRGGRSAAA